MMASRLMVVTRTKYQGCTKGVTAPPYRAIRERTKGVIAPPHRAIRGRTKGVIAHPYRAIRG